MVDIATVDGISVEEDILKGVYSASRSIKIDWPFQQKSKDSYWRVWRKVIKHSLLDYSGNLKEHLGSWLVDTEKIYSSPWTWWLHDETNFLYERDEAGWIKFLPVLQRSRRRVSQRVYRHYVVEDQIPQLSLLKRTSVVYKKGLYIAQGYHNQIVNDNQPGRVVMDNILDISLNNSDTLSALIEAVDKRRGEQWAFKDMLTTDNVDEILQDIANGTAVVVSDGSYKDNGGTAA